MNDELKLKNNLKQARLQKKLSQAQLAETDRRFKKHDQFNRNRTV